jgi:hypothetical protein
MSDKYSKGRWKVEPWMNDSLAVVSQDNNANVDEEGIPQIICELSGPDAQANGRLIVASKKLLRMVERLRWHTNELGQKSCRLCCAYEDNCICEISELIQEATRER